MNGDDYKEMIAHAMIGREVMRIVRETGLMVPRQKPGRKVGTPAGKVEAKVAKPATAKAAKPTEPDDSDD
jgi:hypothetical protein